MIVVPSDQGAWWDAAGGCFMCGGERPTGEITVMWAGLNGTNIWLHVRCSERLGMQLIADAREADLAGSEAVIWRRRAESIKRFRLEQQEWKP
jgi:hypothetical protein